MANTLVNIHGVNTVRAEVNHHAARHGVGPFSTLTIFAGDAEFRLFIDDAEQAQRINDAINAAQKEPA